MNKQWFDQKLDNKNTGTTPFFSRIRLSIRAKVLLVVLVVLILMGLLNLFFISRIWEFSRQYDEIIGNITAANNISAYTKETIDAEMWNIVAGKKTFADGQQYEIIDEINAQIGQLIENTNSPRGQLKLDVVLRTVDTLKKQVDLMGQQIDQGMAVADSEIVLEETRETSTLIQTLLADYMLFEVERSGQQSKIIQSNYTQWIYINLIVMGLIVIFSVVTAWFISASIYAPIKKLHDDITTIVQQDLETPVMSQEMDEITELEVSFNILATQLREHFGLLEDQVRERTSELALSMEVGQRASTIRDLNILLPTVTEFIWDQFSLYYVQVFLIDDIGKNLVLRAGAGTVGQQMMAQGRAVSLEEHLSIVERTRDSLSHGRLSRVPGEYYASLIAHVAIEGSPVVVSNTAGSRFYKPDPLLPETRSELAIPLVVEDRVIGVLDMQDNKENTFTQENLTVFSAMAVQLAISIDSARQWAIAQEAQQRAEKALQQLTREAWADKLVSSWGEEGFVYDLSNVRPLSDAGWASDNNVSVPLVVQDQAIGQLDINAVERDLTNDEQTLLQAVAQQLSQKAENLRLFEATQRRASREQIARQIIDKVRASRNIETALRTAIEELNNALGTARAAVDLQMPQSDLAKSSAQSEAADTGQPTGGANGKTMITLDATETSLEPADHDISDNGEDDEPLE